MHRSWTARAVPVVMAISIAASIAFTSYIATPARADRGAESLSWSDLGNRTGVVVLMRHALAPGGGDPPGFQLGDCSTQRNLSPEGRAQARRIGSNIRASGIEVAGVLASPWCRSAQTARLLGIGPVTTRRYLGSTFTAADAVSARRESRTRQLIASHRDDPGALFLVGHYANIVDLIGLTTDSGEAVAVRMGEDGELDVIGRIRQT